MLVCMYVHITLILEEADQNEQSHKIKILLAL